MVVRSIDKYIACDLLDDTKYPEMSDLVKKTDPPSYENF